MLKKISSVLALIFILAFSLPAFADGANNGYVPFGIDLSYLADNPPREVQEDSPVPLLKASSIPDKYDLRSGTGESSCTSFGGLSAR